MSTPSIRFLMVVEDPAIAYYVSDHGVDRLFVDLEVLGKQDRQGHVASWKSSTTLADAKAIRQAAPEADLLVRVNPINEGSEAEIDAVCEFGADAVMLPMFRHIAELEAFSEFVAGRAQRVALFETLASLDLVGVGAARKLFDEAHFGLNDLHLERADTFMFEPLAEGLLEEPCARLREHAIPFGIGGLARAREGILSPEFLLGEHVRLGSTAAILSRTFHRSAESVEELENEMDFCGEVAKLRTLYDEFLRGGEAKLETNRQMTVDRVNDVVRLIETKRAKEEDC